MVHPVSLSPLVRRLVALALEEDLALGDITSSVTIDPVRRATASIVAKESLVVCGLGIPEVVAYVAGVTLSVEPHVDEGVIASPKATLVTLKGTASELLALERTILNFMQRMSGVATYTRRFVEEAGGKITVLDTRKTLPGWRVLDKYSVVVGGGRNHRFSLGDMILVKNNHIDAHPKGIEGALSEITSKKPPYMSWEVEVRDLQELKVALTFAPTTIMLDNFSDELVVEAVALVASAQPRPLIEVSGGMSSGRAKVLSEKGIDAVSAGALTTSARNVDISMRIMLD